MFALSLFSNFPSFRLLWLWCVYCVCCILMMMLLLTISWIIVPYIPMLRVLIIYSTHILCFFMCVHISLSSISTCYMCLYSARNIKRVRWRRRQHIPLIQSHHPFFLMKSIFTDTTTRHDIASKSNSMRKNRSRWIAWTGYNITVEKRDEKAITLIAYYAFDWIIYFLILSLLSFPFFYSILYVSSSVYRRDVSLFDCTCSANIRECLLPTKLSLSHSFSHSSTCT